MNAAASVDDIPRVTAALAEGFCPEGHLLTYGGGKWGSCTTCHLGWATCPVGYTRRALGQTSQYTLVTAQGESIFYESESGTP